MISTSQGPGLHDRVTSSYLGKLLVICWETRREKSLGMGHWEARCETCSTYFQLSGRRSSKMISEKEEKDDVCLLLGCKCPLSSSRQAKQVVKRHHGGAWGGTINKSHMNIGTSKERTDWDKKYDYFLPFPPFRFLSSFANAALPLPLLANLTALRTFTSDSAAAPDDDDLRIFRASLSIFEIKSRFDFVSFSIGIVEGSN